MEKEFKFSCADCHVSACDSGKDNHPQFCYTKNMEPEFLKEAIAEYDKDNNRQMMITAANVEFEHYCKNTRLQDTMDFARGMGFKKIGIATCVGLLKETNTLARILRANGFEVVAVGCKVGSYPKTEMGIDEQCCQVGNYICNPIMQAKLLNSENTEMNIIMGLCVGHDMLFTKYSEAPVTTLVAKDRVLAHNPVGAIYQAETYYRKKLGL